MNTQYELLDIPFMGCDYFVHVTQGMDWEAPDYFIGDYLLSDEKQAEYFCLCVYTHGLDFTLNKYNPHKMTAQDWSQYDQMILAIH